MHTPRRHGVASSSVARRSPSLVAQRRQKVARAHRTRAEPAGLGGAAAAAAAAEADALGLAVAAEAEAWLGEGARAPTRGRASAREREEGIRRGAATAAARRRLGRRRRRGRRRGGHLRASAEAEEGLRIAGAGRGRRRRCLAVCKLKEGVGGVGRRGGHGRASVLGVGVREEAVSGGALGSGRREAFVGVVDDHALTAGAAQRLLGTAVEDVAAHVEAGEGTVCQQQVGEGGAAARADGVRGEPQRLERCVPLEHVAQHARALVADLVAGQVHRLQRAARPEQHTGRADGGVLQAAVVYFELGGAEHTVGVEPRAALHAAQPHRPVEHRVEPLARVRGRLLQRGAITEEGRRRVAHARQLLLEHAPRVGLGVAGVAQPLERAPLGREQPVGQLVLRLGAQLLGEAPLPVRVALRRGCAPRARIRAVLGLTGEKGLELGAVAAHELLEPRLVLLGPFGRRPALLLRLAPQPALHHLGLAVAAAPVGAAAAAPSVVGTPVGAARLLLLLLLLLLEHLAELEPQPPVLAHQPLILHLQLHIQLPDDVV